MSKTRVALLVLALAFMGMAVPAGAQTAVLSTSVDSASITEGGAAGSFTVVLGAQPTTPVTVSVVSSDTLQATVSPAYLTFTSDNWSANRQCPLQPLMTPLLMATRQFQ